MSNIYTLSSDEAKKLLDTNEAILIDVREPAEFRSEKIVQATNIPLSKITAQDVQQLMDGDKRVIMSCRSGKRSLDACNKLIQDVGIDLYTLEGGIMVWQQQGLAVEKSTSKMLPLDRQVQLVISLMILIGLLISYTISSYGLLLPLMAGVGLLNAALTGWCGMAKLLAKMPWNQ